MKRSRLPYIPLILILALVSACQFPLDDASGVQDISSTAEFLLPPDSSDDTLRTLSEDFKYETLVPVKLDLSFSVYEFGDNEELLPVVFSDTSTSDPPRIYIRLMDAAGNHLYAGSAFADTRLKKTMYIPAAPQDLELVLEAEGIQTRRVRINAMAEYSTVQRTFSMLYEKNDSSVSSSIRGRGLGSLKDSDGDGVPDTYDMFPDDPKAAFSMNVPSAERITIAFEDLFGSARAGDADYNDFIATYTINEIMNADGQVTRVEVQAEALQKLAGYNHSFGIRFDSFEGQANLVGSFINRGGNVARLAGRPNAPVEIVLFDGTERAVGKTAWFVLEFDQPQTSSSDSEKSGSVSLARPPYNPYLYVHNTRHDIHLIDAEPLTRSNNPDDRFIDDEGFPWALMIPVDWDHPAEGQRIEVLYPRFTAWRESGGNTDRDWYEYPYDPNDPGTEEAVVYAAGYYNDGAKDAAVYWTDNGTEITRVSLHTESTAQGTDIAVSADGTVYVAGYYEVGTTLQAAYWADDGTAVTQVNLASGGRATGITVDDSGTVYVSGYYGTSPKKAVYWIDDGVSVTEVVLDDAAEAEGTDIFMDNEGTIYVSGFYTSSGSRRYGYWADDEGVIAVEDIPTDSTPMANAISVYGSSVYVAGRNNSGSGLTAVYWHNSGAAVALNASAANAWGIWTGAPGIYVAGHYFTGSVHRAVWWRDSAANQEVLLGENPGYSSYGYDIELDGSDIYVAGTQQTADNTEEAVYWKNGNLTVLESAARSRGVAIQIVP